MKAQFKNVLLLFAVLLGGCDGTTTEDPVGTIEEYLERNQIEDYIATSSGLIYTVNKIGGDEEDEFAQLGQTITVHYTGYHLDDSKFDSSYDRNEAFVFILGDEDIIPGWNEGLQYFKKGGSGTLYIPWELAYGEKGSFDGTIRPKEDIKFDINILAID